MRQGTFPQFFRAHHLTEALRRELPQHAQQPFEDALAGTGSTALLIVSSPSRYRGNIAYLWFLRHRIGQCSLDDFRTALLEAWLHDHDAVRRAVGTRRDLIRMFRAARFTPPPELPERVRLWRGVHLDIPAARRGLSWTVRRSEAEWFARQTLHNPRACPVVLSAEVPRSAVLLYTDERGEGEVVCNVVAEAPQIVAESLTA